MKKQNNHFKITATLTADTNSPRQNLLSPLSPLPETNDICPDCHIRLIRLGACFSCPTCGYGSCG